MRSTLLLPAMLAGLQLLSANDTPFPTDLHIKARAAHVLGSEASCRG
jgi:hypothetical protein